MFEFRKNGKVKWTNGKRNRELLLFSKFIQSTSISSNIMDIEALDLAFSFRYVCLTKYKSSTSSTCGLYLWIGNGVVYELNKKRFLLLLTLT